MDFLCAFKRVGRFVLCKLDDCVCVCMCEKCVREYCNRRVLIIQKFRTFTNNSSCRSCVVFLCYDVAKFNHFHDRVFFLYTCLLFLIIFTLIALHMTAHTDLRVYDVSPFSVFFGEGGKHVYIICKLNRHIDRRKKIPFELKWRHSNI